MAQLDFVADILCPWCFIARRRMQPALDRLGVGWAWRPFLLDPAAPVDGRPAPAHWAARFSSAEAAARYHDGVAEAGRAAGIGFRYDRIARVPHARDAHRLILLAQARGRQAPMAEALSWAYFEDGQDIGDAAVLTALAAPLGLAAEAADMLAGSALSAEVDAADRLAKRHGIGAVPGFCLHGKILPVRQIDEIGEVVAAADRALARRA